MVMANEQGNNSKSGIICACDNDLHAQSTRDQLIDNWILREVRLFERWEWDKDTEFFVVPGYRLFGYHRQHIKYHVSRYINDGKNIHVMPVDSNIHYFYGILLFTDDSGVKQCQVHLGNAAAKYQTNEQHP